MIEKTSCTKARNEACGNWDRIAAAEIPMQTTGLGRCSKYLIAASFGAMAIIWQR